MERKNQAINLFGCYIKCSGPLVKVLNDIVIDGRVTIDFEHLSNITIKNVTFTSTVTVTNLDVADRKTFKGCVFEKGLYILGNTIIQNGFGNNFELKEKLVLDSEELPASCFKKMNVNSFEAVFMKKIHNKNLFKNSSSLTVVKLPAMEEYSDVLFAGIKNIQSLSLGGINLPTSKKFLSGCKVGHLTVMNLDTHSKKTLSGLTNCETISLIAPKVKIKKGLFSNLRLINVLYISGQTLEVDKHFLRSVGLVYVDMDIKKPTKDSFSFLDNRIVFGNISFDCVLEGVTLLNNSTVCGYVKVRNIINERYKKVRNKVDSFCSLFPKLSSPRRPFLLKYSMSFSAEPSHFNLIDEENFFIEDDNFVYADFILSRYDKKKTLGNLVVYSLRKDWGYKYLVRLDNLCAHGYSLKDAVKSVNEKALVRAELEKIIVEKESKRYSVDEAVDLYRKVTGACKAGCEAFLKQRKIDKNSTDTFSIEDIALMTENQYGHHYFVKRLELNLDEIKKARQ